MQAPSNERPGFGRSATEYSARHQMFHNRAAGEFTPEVSPLDQFIFQGRLLSKELKQQKVGRTGADPNLPSVSSGQPSYEAGSNDAGPQRIAAPIYPRFSLATDDGSVGDRDSLISDRDRDSTILGNFLVPARNQAQLGPQPDRSNGYRPEENRAPASARVEDDAPSPIDRAPPKSATFTTPDPFPRSHDSDRGDGEDRPRDGNRREGSRREDSRREGNRREGRPHGGSQRERRPHDERAREGRREDRGRREQYSRSRSQPPPRHRRPGAGQGPAESQGQPNMPYAKREYVPLRKDSAASPVGPPSRQNSSESGRFAAPARQGSAESGRFPPPARQGSAESGRFPPPMRQDSAESGKFPPPSRQGSAESGRFPPPARQGSGASGRLQPISGAEVRPVPGPSPSSRQPQANTGPTPQYMPYRQDSTASVNSARRVPQAVQSPEDADRGRAVHRSMVASIRGVSPTESEKSSHTVVVPTQPGPSPQPSPQPPDHSFAQFDRSPSAASNHSLRPTFNFSRPMSNRPSIDIPSADGQPTANDAPPTPVSFVEDGKEGAGPAPTQIYSRFNLPRGREMSPRDSVAFQDWITIDGQKSPNPDSSPRYPPTGGISNLTLPDGRSSRKGPPSQLAPTGHHLQPIPSPRLSPSPNRGISPSSRPGTGKSSGDPPRTPRTHAANMTPDEHLSLGIDLHEKGSLAESTYHLRCAALGGHATGMLMYALACRHGWGMRPNQAEGVKWLKEVTKLASGEVADDENGLTNAPYIEKQGRKAQFALSIYELGVSHLNGWGTEMDKGLALNCFEIAGKWGDTDALSEAGFCYANGVGCKKDLKKAAKFYRMAATKGVSMVGNAWIYKEKYNMPEDDKSSKKGKKEGGGIFSRKKSVV